MFENNNVWKSAWGALGTMRGISKDEESRIDIFRWGLEDISPLAKTISGGAQCAQSNSERRGCSVKETRHSKLETGRFFRADVTEFVFDVLHPHGTIVIGDTVQLPGSVINALFGAVRDFFRLVAESRNVLCWDNKRYAKCGAELVLTKSTESLIAKNRIKVWGFYLRGGRNFSADWATRAGDRSIDRWGKCGAIYIVTHLTGSWKSLTPIRNELNAGVFSDRNDQTMPNVGRLLC